MTEANSRWGDVLFTEDFSGRFRVERLLRGGSVGQPRASGEQNFVFGLTLNARYSGGGRGWRNSSHGEQSSHERCVPARFVGEGVLHAHHLALAVLV
jgi:hypothetical protein